MASDPIVIVGAGIGGLAAAALLARQGTPVLVLERAGHVGGKARQIHVDGAAIDAGPTVFTMRWVFEELAADCGTTLDALVSLTQARVLARHYWTDGSALDLHADPDVAEAAIAAFAGPAEARGFRAFAAAARRCYQALEAPFIRGKLPTMMSLAFTIRSPADLLAIKPFATLWSELGSYFRDPRLRQLFGRYATYCGSSPFQAPATLMLVAHVELDGVCTVEGGMPALAHALAGLVERLGGQIRTAAEVSEIITDRRRVSAVRLASGETIPAAAAILNADPAALAAGCFGANLRHAITAPARSERSLSCFTWAGRARPEGVPLAHHTVFFADDYRAEFDAIARGHMPAAPTVYVCAQDRRDAGPADGRERLLLLINAPPDGDAHAYTQPEVDQCRQNAWSLLDRCGLTLQEPILQPTTPTEWNARYPSTGGALYGPSVHGAMASFRRPGSRTNIPGLYLAGGATHPGAGVPMAALSGRLAASAVTADLASTWRSRATAMPGGMSTR